MMIYKIPLKCEYPHSIKFCQYISSIWGGKEPTFGKLNIWQVAYSKTIQLLPKQSQNHKQSPNFNDLHQRDSFRFTHDVYNLENGGGNLCLLEERFRRKKMQQGGIAAAAASTAVLICPGWSEDVCQI